MWYLSAAGAKIFDFLRLERTNSYSKIMFQGPVFQKIRRWRRSNPLALERKSKDDQETYWYDLPTRKRDSITYDMGSLLRIADGPPYR